MTASAANMRTAKSHDKLVASRNFQTTMATTNQNKTQLQEGSAANLTGVGPGSPMGDFILNYPYSYDQDGKNEVLF